jgi:hypothetical protein
MAVATNEGMEFSVDIQSLNEDYLSALTRLPDNYTEEDKFALINLIEKFKVAMNYLRINDHTKFWSVLKIIIEKEMVFRELVLEITSDPNVNMKYEEQEIKSIIWKFGVYNNFRLVLLQEISNVITYLYEKAKLFSHVNSSVARNVIEKANKVGNYYINQFKDVMQTVIIEEDNFINNCVEILENSIQIGKESLKGQFF